MFDAAHGYGLGIVMAFLSQSSVVLADHGTCLHVLYQEPLRTLAANTCIKELLQLPTVETLTQQTASDVTRKNLDGLLAILFTSPGVRAISTNDLLSKGRQNIDVLEQGVAKASTAVERWGKQVARRTSGLDWGSYLLQSYGANSITAPVPVLKENRHITISMTIDPIFSYSTRQAMSDGRVADKTNVSIEGTPDAPILAIIGAARLLGAQRVAHGIVLYSIPVVQSVELMAETARPLLRFVEQPVEQAIAKMWLGRNWGYSAPDGSWSGLAYQTMQTQGAQQSISSGYGFLSTQWLDAVEQRAGRAVLRQWKSLISDTDHEVSADTDYLIDCLLNHQESAWLAHLRDIAYRMSQQLLSSTPLYTVHEVKEITNLMTLSVTSPLRSILEREQGTKRFGHALRLLGQRNASALRDLIDLLDCVRDQAALIRVLARAAQECAVVAARTDFIIVPNDDDLAFLLDDVTQYGVQTVATLIIILSALRYPAVKDNNNPVAEVEQAGKAARDESELPLNTSFSAELSEN